MQRLEIPKIQAAPFQLLPGLSEPVSQMAAQDGDRQEGHRVNQDLVHGVARGPERGESACELRRSDHLGPLRQDQEGIQEAAQDADHQTASALQHAGGGKDHEDVHEGEDGIEATREMHQEADQGEIERDLHQALPVESPLAAQGQGVNQREGEGETQETVQGGRAEGETLVQIEDPGRAQERRRQQKAHADEPLQLDKDAGRDLGRAPLFIRYGH